VKVKKLVLKRKFSQDQVHREFKSNHFKNKFLQYFHFFTHSVSNEQEKSAEAAKVSTANFIF